MKTKRGREKPSKKHSVAIVWGTEKAFKQTYAFKTHAELEAFLMGVDEAEGWLDYEIVDEEDS